jgi:secreted Zn-dependent insulinase-like peptidase
MYKSCTIIPTHLPHFGFIINVLKTYNKNVNGDLYLIFSTADEYETFKSKTSEKFSHLILDDSFKCYSNIITAKIK